MKKAWELSVLCGAEVSILIFSNAGKPYEFSSRDLDFEVDRYLEYEGLIERRRGEEFAAMAEAGEDDDDDDDDGDTRRGSTAKGAAANGQPKPTKSLKGKESFKKRMPSLRDMGRGGKRKRGGRDEGQGQLGFIEGLVGSDEEDGPSGASSVSLALALLLTKRTRIYPMPWECINRSPTLTACHIAPPYPPIKGGIAR